jgi:hypothetical protein
MSQQGKSILPVHVLWVLLNFYHFPYEPVCVPGFSSLYADVVEQDLMTKNSVVFCCCLEFGSNGTQQPGTWIDSEVK